MDNNRRLTFAGSYRTERYIVLREAPDYRPGYLLVGIPYPGEWPPWRRIKAAATAGAHGGEEGATSADHR